MRLRSALLILASAASLTACSSYYDDYGYGGVSVGFGTGYYNGGLYGHGYYGGGYYDPWFDPYWSFYSSYPYWGWYNGFYYPGTGVFVYDHWRRRHHWDDDHRSHWTERRRHWEGRGGRTSRGEWRENWRDFSDSGDWQGRGGRRGDWRGNGGDGRMAGERGEWRGPRGDRGGGRGFRQGPSGDRSTMRGRETRSEPSRFRERSSTRGTIMNRSGFGGRGMSGRGSGRGAPRTQTP